MQGCLRLERHEQRSACRLGYLSADGIGFRGYNEDGQGVFSVVVQWRFGITVLADFLVQGRHGQRTHSQPGPHVGGPGGRPKVAEQCVGNLSMGTP